MRYLPPSFGLPPAHAFVRSLATITTPATWHHEQRGQILCKQYVPEPRHRRGTIDASEMPNTRFCRSCDAEARRLVRRS